MDGTKSTANSARPEMSTGIQRVDQQMTQIDTDEE
jgi:hypothetical protein